MTEESTIQWTESTLDDFEDLRTLLRECQSIESSNCIIDRLNRIIALADKINRRRWSSDSEYQRSLFHEIENGFNAILHARWVAKGSPNA